MSSNASNVLPVPTLDKKVSLCRRHLTYAKYQGKIPLLNVYVVALVLHPLMASMTSKNSKKIFPYVDAKVVRSSQIALVTMHSTACRTDERYQTHLLQRPDLI